MKLYFCFTMASLLALLGLTSYSIYKQRTNTDVSDEDNFTVSIIQFIGLCEYRFLSREAAGASSLECSRSDTSVPKTGRFAAQIV